MYRVHNYWSANTKFKQFSHAVLTFSARAYIYYTIMTIHIHTYPTIGKLYIMIIKLERMRSARCRESIVFEWASRKSIAKDYLNQWSQRCISLAALLRTNGHQQLWSTERRNIEMNGESAYANATWSDSHCCSNRLWSRFGVPSMWYLFVCILLK